MHIETRQVIFITNLLIGFYMYERFVLNGLNNGSNESDITFTIFKVLLSLDGTSYELLIYMELSESAKPHTRHLKRTLMFFMFRAAPATSPSHILLPQSDSCFVSICITRFAT